MRASVPSIKSSLLNQEQLSRLFIFLDFNSSFMGPLYLRNAKVFLFFFFFFFNKNMLTDQRVAVWQLAFRARKVLGTIEKQVPIA